MAYTVESRDPYTGGHLWWVAQYGRMLAEHMGLDRHEVAKVMVGGFLHDLGKVGIPDAILRKPGALTEEELAVIRTHPVVGARLLVEHPLAGLVGDAVAYHHERPDGGGYPYGLAGGDIPLQARLVGVCDAFDAMTSHRPYRAGMPMERALEIVRDQRGRQFDAAAAEAFCALPTEELAHVQGHSDDGIPLRECPMCGPTLVVRRDQRPGALLHCRSCAGTFELTVDGGVRPTGATATPAQMEPEPDLPLIRDLIGAAARHISAAG